MNGRHICVIFVLLLMMGSCAPSPIQDTLLYGYRDGKKQMKYTTSIVVDKLENGDRGYRLNTHINYGLGTKETMESVRTSWLRDDFTVEKVEVDREYNGKTVSTRIQREGETLVIRKKEGDADETEMKVPISGLVFTDVHPLLYTADLKEVGSEKAYPILHEASGTVKSMTVKYVGNPVMDINGTRKATMHFKLEKLSAPGEFEDYYLDSKTREPVKIDMGVVQFLPDN